MLQYRNRLSFVKISSPQRTQLIELNRFDFFFVYLFSCRQRLLQYLACWALTKSFPHTLQVIVLLFGVFISELCAGAQFASG